MMTEGITHNEGFGALHLNPIELHLAGKIPHRTSRIVEHLGELLKIQNYSLMTVDRDFKFFLNNGQNVLKRIMGILNSFLC